VTGDLVTVDPGEELRRHFARQACHDWCGFTLELHGFRLNRVERHGLGVGPLGADGLKDRPRSRPTQREEYGLVFERRTRKRVEECKQDARVTFVFGPAMPRSKRQEHRPECVQQKGRPEGMMRAPVQGDEGTNKLVSFAEG
jgi:hypothetical protein